MPNSSRLRQLSIRVKLLIPIFVALLVAFLVFLIRVPLPVNALIEENIRANFSTVLNSVQMPLTQSLDTQARDLLSMASSVEMQGYLDASENSTKNEQIMAQAGLGSQIVGQITDGNQPYSQIRYIDARGKVIIQARTRLIGDAISGILLPVDRLLPEPIDDTFQKIRDLPSGSAYLFPIRLSQPASDLNLPPEALITIGVPVMYQSQPAGILIGSFRARKVLEAVFRQSGSISRYQLLLLDQAGQAAALMDAHMQDSVALFGDPAIARLEAPPVITDGLSADLIKASGRVYQERNINNPSGVPMDQWRFVISDDLRTAYAESRNLQSTLTLTLAVVFVIAAGGIVLVSQSVIRPLLQVSDVADRIANGDLTAKAPLTSQDEVGMVALALNTMTMRLSELIHTLEQRVSERTRDLEVSADISRQITTLLDLTELLQAAAERTKTGFNLYHVAVFLYNPANDCVTFEAGIDSVGVAVKGAGLRLSSTDAGLVAESVRSRQVVLSNDTLNDPRYLPVLLLPNTRSELVLPMQIGRRLIGVLDCQAETANRFSPDDVRVMTTFAEQLGIAVNNVQLFSASEKARRRAETLSEINSRVTQATNEQMILAAIAPAAYAYGAAFAILSYFHMGESNEQLFVEIVAYTRADALPLPAEPLLPKYYSAETYPGLRQLLEIESQPMFIPDLQNNARWNEAEKAFARQIGMGAAILIPLKSGGQWQALLSFGWVLPQTFDSELQELIVILMPRLADNIAGRRAYLSAQAARQEMERLYQVSQEMNAAQSYTGIVEAIARSLDDLSYNLTLSLYENYDKASAVYFDIVAIRPAGQSIVIDPHLRFEAASIEGWAQETLFVVEDLNKPSPMREDTAAYYRKSGVGAMMAAGLILGQRVIGLLNLTVPSPRIFTANEKNFLRSVADLTAAAVERTRLFNEQVQVVERLREVDNTKSRFLASMSHELRTPLNAILNFSKFVARGMLGPVNEKQVDALTKAITSGHHLLSLINDVLDMTKIESNMLTLFIETDIDLQAELDTVLAAAETLLADKPVQLIRQITPTLPLVTGDKRRIRQIMFNLISNACKFTQQGSITLSAQQEDEITLLMFVRDTGPGIAPEEQIIIFEAFRQTELGLRQGGGTGLGLVIARRLAEAHGGRLWVESTPGAGATFYVRLPIHAAASPPQE